MAEKVNELGCEHLNKRDFEMLGRVFEAEILNGLPVPEANSQWLINGSDMKRCCYQSLQYEGYRRKDNHEQLMVKGQILICSTCNAEMICELGESKRLRWGMQKDAV